MRLKKGFIGIRFSGSKNLRKIAGEMTSKSLAKIMLWIKWIPVDMWHPFAKISNSFFSRFFLEIFDPSFSFQN
jgi:hypothetical protein